MDRINTLMKQTLKFRIWGPQNATCQVVTLEELAELEDIPTPGQVEQFTGVLDKYNQEIYVGDILRCRDFEGAFYYQQVEFSHSGFNCGRRNRRRRLSANASQQRSSWKYEANPGALSGRN